MMNKRIFTVLLTGLFSLVIWAQGSDALSQLKADPRKSYGNDYPYPLKKADAVLTGSSDHIADLRFGHDTCLGPLTVLMGINGADRDPEDPYEVKNCYQNWETCKASNILIISGQTSRTSTRNAFKTPPASIKSGRITTPWDISLTGGGYDACQQEYP